MEFAKAVQPWYGSCQTESCLAPDYIVAPSNLDVSAPSGASMHLHAASHLLIFLRLGRALQLSLLQKQLFLLLLAFLQVLLESGNLLFNLGHPILKVTFVFSGAHSCSRTASCLPGTRQQLTFCGFRERFGFLISGAGSPMSTELPDPDPGGPHSPSSAGQ